MGNGIRYWHLVTIDAGGKKKTREITVAKGFFAQIFPEYTASSDVPDTQVQRTLLQLSRDDSNEKSTLAQRCLLCFISWQIEQVCWQLEEQFGKAHGFTSNDLLPYVLDDDGNLTPTSNYQCLGRKILQSFDTSKSNLNNWINIKVKQHPELNKFLLELGIYRVTDWAILNDTTPKKLQHILQEFHSLTSTEIANFTVILNSYHEIYKSQRLQKLAGGNRGICPQPTNEQLSQMSVILNNRIGQSLNNETIMAKLQTLASYLRQYRIYQQNRCLPEVIESPPETVYVAKTDENTDENEEMEFLQLYRNHFLLCLEESFAIVLNTWLNKLKSKKKNQADNFFRALQLFHCQHQSMTEIAQSLGLRAQDAVTRLLKLKDFRADVQREFVKNLCDRVLELAHNYSHPQRLKQVEQQISSIIHTSSQNLIREAEIKARIINNADKASLFSETLCRYLDSLSR